MLLKDAGKAVVRRLKSPVYWGVALLLGIPVELPKLLQLSHQTDFMDVATKALLTLAEIVIGCVLFAFPWQWTRDHRLMASWKVGVPQALCVHFLVEIPPWKWTPSMIKTLGSKWLDWFKPDAVMFFGSFVFITYIVALWEARRREKAEALAQLEAARWTLLKGQMSPHVLLNSINGLAELVREDAEAAVKGMRDLAEIYKQLLASCEAPTVRLEKERRLLESYLAVEQLRLGHQLKVHWDWAPELDQVETIPLLLQPLVENAIKHGVSSDPNGGVIAIQGRLEGQTLYLCVSNTGIASAPRKRGTGIGINNLKSRLELATRGKGSFQLVRESPWTRAELVVPLDSGSSQTNNPRWGWVGRIGKRSPASPAPL